jgi:Rrf2 family transcriptional regulator, cysteine metabolism repressor
MKLSTNSRYGLRAMVDLAANYAGAPVSLSALAARQSVSESYLEQLFSMLRKAGFVRSAKGAQGGYMPVEEPDGVRAGDILRILEGDLSIIDDSPAYCADDPVKRCIKERVWDVVNGQIARTLDSATLGGLAEDYRRMRGGAQAMYYI